MDIDIGNLAEIIADVISVIALATSIALPAIAASKDRLFKDGEQRARALFEQKQAVERREFEERQIQRVEESERRIAEFESTLRRTDAARAKLLDDIKDLEAVLGEVFSKFENLLRISRTAQEDTLLVQACRESLQPLIDLQKIVDRLKFILDPRHERELEEFETVLMTIFLDVRRVTQDRNEQYLAQIVRYEAELGRYEKLAKRIIDTIHGSAGVASNGPLKEREATRRKH